MIWLVCVALAALVLWVIAGVIDECAHRRPLPRVRQPVRAAARARPGDSRPGRHARPGGPQ